MIESPLLAEVRAQGAVRNSQENILLLLEVQFGAVPATFEATIRAIANINVLTLLVRAAGVCASLDEFGEKLSQLTSLN